MWVQFGVFDSQHPATFISTLKAAGRSPAQLANDGSFFNNNANCLHLYLQREISPGVGYGGRPRAPLSSQSLHSQVAREAQTGCSMSISSICRRLRWCRAYPIHWVSLTPLTKVVRACFYSRMEGGPWRTGAENRPCSACLPLRSRHSSPLFVPHLTSTYLGRASKRFWQIFTQPDSCTMISPSVISCWTMPAYQR
jgi:hypothetical protein